MSTRVLVEGTPHPGDAVTPPSSETKADRRRQILDAAVKVFAHKGHHDTRIQDIADEAGVAYGLVYHYFGTKDRLLRTVFDENWAIFAAVVDAIATSDRTSGDQIRAVLDYAMGSLEAYPDRLRVILVEWGRLARQGETLDHPDVQRVITTIAAMCEQAQRAGRLAPGADPAAIPVLFLGAMQAACVAALTDGSDGTPRLPRQAVRDTVLALFRGVIEDPAP